MKTVAILSSFLLISLVSGISLQAGLLNPLQLSIGEVANFAHRHVQKRQTLNDLTTEDVVNCTSATIEHQCSAGYAQGVIDIALRCRNETAARSTSISCARNEDGETCAVATLRLSSDSTQSSNAAQCFGAVSSGFCPSACRSFLQTARSRLGCCINTYVNTTYSPVYNAYRNFVDYRLWNLCNVDLPPADCGNAPPLNTPVEVQTCTVEEYFTRLVNYECFPSVGQPLVDALLQNPRCRVYAVLTADLCESNSNGQFCAQAISLDSLISESTDPLLVSLANCGTSTSTCSTFCQDVVTNVNGTYGCCVNIYNNSDIGRQFPSLSYSYWNLCGVKTPGFCESTLSLSNSAVLISFAWSVVTMLGISMFIQV